MNVKINEPIKYKDYLNLVQRSKKMIEINIETQIGFTFRVFEALTFNKLLITNNPLVSEMPFYNPRYIKIVTIDEKFDMPTFDCDCAEYNYNGEYSCNNFLKRIISDLYINQKKSIGERDEKK